MRKSFTSLECFDKKEKQIFDLDFPENRTVWVKHVSQRPYVNSIISLFECTVQEKKRFHPNQLVVSFSLISIKN